MRKRGTIVLALLVWLAAAGELCAQGTRKDDIVLNRFGQPVAGANVTVCTSGATGTPCSPLASIYSDVGLTQPLANPMTTDGQGNYHFYAAPARYKIQISGAGTTTTTIPDVLLAADPTSPSYQSLSVAQNISALSLNLSGNLAVTGNVNSTTSVSAPQTGNTAPVEIGPAWYPGTASGLAPSPLLAPAVVLESASGGTIAAGTYYCVETYGNRNGETLASPQKQIVVAAGATNQINVSTNNDKQHFFGTYKMRVYCGTVSGGPYFLQTPKTVSYTAVNNGLSRTSNVDTVTFAAATGLARNQQITVAGDAGCGTSFAGTYRITASSVDSKTFTFPQTAGNDAACGGAAITVSYPLAIDTNWAYAVDGGGFEVIFTAIVGAGSNPPVTNTATIDPIQVAVNAARLPTGAVTRQGSVLLGGGNYTLTTPLILGFSAPAVVGQAPTVKNEGGGSGTTILCPWNDYNTGCVMIMGNLIDMENLFILAQAGATAGILITPGFSDFNGIYTNGVNVQADGTNAQACGIRIFRVATLDQGQFNNMAINSGGRGGLCGSNSSLSPISINYGRINAGSVIGSSFFIYDGGPTDWARGVNFGGFTSAMGLDIYNVDGEQNSGPAIDLVNVGDVTIRSFTNSDAVGMPAGTLASALAMSNDFFGGGGHVYLGTATVLFASANASATINFATGSAAPVFKCDGAAVEGSSFSGAAVGIALNNTAGSVYIVNCPLLSINPTSATSRITGISILGGTNNTFAFVPVPSSAVFADAMNAATGPLKTYEAKNSANSRTWSLSGNVYDLFNSDGTTELIRQNSGSLGNFSFLGTLGFMGITPGNNFIMTGTPSAPRTITWPDNSGTVAELNVAQTWTQTQTFSGVGLSGDTSFSASPRPPLNAFFPGALTSTWTGLTFTPDKAITVTRFQAQAKTAPAGCTTNAVIRLTDGTTPVNLTVSSASPDSGAISQNYAAGAVLTVSISTAASGCTTSPADINVTVQYRMQ
jgi:hypothetical protein